MTSATLHRFPEVHKILFSTIKRSTLLQQWFQMDKSITIGIINNCINWMLIGGLVGELGPSQIPATLLVMQHKSKIDLELGSDNMSYF